ncbi:MAG: adenylyltransferase/cytidyltransferase family protein [Solirubrobacterales bacterium]|nr:adenylyltransferase/cytidyltransferase family protein [Solirubrobacterales bacterium]
MESEYFHCRDEPIRGTRGAGRGRLDLRWHTRPVLPAPGTVVATGVFDVLHVGHLHFLRSARAAGTGLVVGVEDDERAHARKGAGRPIVTAAERCELLAALEPVDGVFMISGPSGLAPAPAYYALLAPLEPAALAFTAGDPAEAGKRIVAARLGARVVEVPQLQGRSTTWLVTRSFDAFAPGSYAAPISATHDATPGPPSVCATPRRAPMT